MSIPHGAALNNTLRQVAASIGGTVLVTVMTATARDPEVYGVAGLVHGANVTFVVAGVLSAVGIVGALFLTNSRYTEQMDSH